MTLYIVSPLPLLCCRSSRRQDIKSFDCSPIRDDGVDVVMIEGVGAIVGSYSNNNNNNLICLDVAHLNAILIMSSARFAIINQQYKIVQDMSFGK